MFDISVCGWHKDHVSVIQNLLDEYESNKSALPDPLFSQWIVLFDKFIENAKKRIDAGKPSCDWGETVDLLRSITRWVAELESASLPTWVNNFYNSNLMKIYRILSPVLNHDETRHYQSVFRVSSKAAISFLELIKENNLFNKANILAAFSFTCKTPLGAVLYLTDDLRDHLSIKKTLSQADFDLLLEAAFLNSEFRRPNKRILDRELTQDNAGAFSASLTDTVLLIGQGTPKASVVASIKNLKPNCLLMYSSKVDQPTIAVSLPLLCPGAIFTISSKVETLPPSIMSSLQQGVLFLYSDRYRSLISTIKSLPLNTSLYIDPASKIAVDGMGQFKDCFASILNKGISIYWHLSMPVHIVRKIEVLCKEKGFEISNKDRVCRAPEVTVKNQLVTSKPNTLGLSQSVSEPFSIKPMDVHQEIGAVPSASEQIQDLYTPAPPTVASQLAIPKPVFLVSKALAEANVGVDPKYLGGRAARLPQAKYHNPERGDVRQSFKHTLSLKQLKSKARASMDDDLAYVPLLCGSLVGMYLYTYNENIKATDKVIFIFAGRNENAFIPDIPKSDDSNIRIILVGPSDDYESMQSYLEPGIDYLVIDHLESSTHGLYEKPGLLNSRRIAAFIASMLFKERYGILYAMMVDDNLQTVYFNSTEETVTWDDYFNLVQKELNHPEKGSSVCVSVPTCSALRIRETRDAEMGCKLYMFHLDLLYKKLKPLKTDEAPIPWFLPFFPAKANAFYGEDSYFQLMFQALFAPDGIKGYRVVDSSQFGLSRAQIGSLCNQFTDKVSALCEVNDCDLFEDKAFDELGHLIIYEEVSARVLISKVIQQLSVCMTDNLIRYQNELKISKTAHLMKLHAAANGLRYIEPQSMGLVEESSFLRRFCDSVQNITDGTPELKPYQKAIMFSIFSALNGQKNIGQIDMATGTGKSHIKIWLAIAALLAGTNKPIILVTPYKQLVQQLYDSFLKVLQGIKGRFPIHPSQIIKMDSNSASISADTLLVNRTLDGVPCVIISCEASYQKILGSSLETVPQLASYQNPSLVLVDESHMQESTLKSFFKRNPNTQNSFVAGFSATPKPSVLKQDGGRFFYIHYDRTNAVAGRNLAPCMLRKWNQPYRLDTVMQLIKSMPSFLREHIAPNGQPLMEQKGIIYVPNNQSKNDNNYSRALKKSLAADSISSLEVNTKEGNAQGILLSYSRDSRREDAANILICKDMGKVGFSDNEVHWIIYLQNGDEADFCQSAGRAMRVSVNNPYKVAYIIAFSDVRSSLLFPEGERTADEMAFIGCHKDFEFTEQLDIQVEDVVSDNDSLGMDDGRLAEVESQPTVSPFRETSALLTAPLRDSVTMAAGSKRMSSDDTSSEPKRPKPDERLRFFTPISRETDELGNGPGAAAADQETSFSPMPGLGYP